MKRQQEGDVKNKKKKKKDFNCPAKEPGSLEKALFASSFQSMAVARWNSPEAWYALAVPRPDCPSGHKIPYAAYIYEDILYINL